MYSKLRNNDNVVQKYGGTSVGSPERIRDVAKRVARLHRQGHRRLAIVVSAMAGETNRLVALVRETNVHASLKSYDMAISAGEQVSVALMAAALEAEGLSVSPYLAYRIGIKTDEFHSRARILSIDTHLIEQDWEKGAISVIAGFQGVNEALDITTLGRGGSDTSAVALACALNSAFCEINTDVNGVYSADPRIVPEAKLIQSMNYETALEMASMGSKVLHPRCVELGAKYQIPIVVRNTFTDDDSDRTIVMDYKNQIKGTSLETNEAIESPAVNGVTMDKDVACLTIACRTLDSALLAGMFAAVAEKGVNVDVIVHEHNKALDQMVLGFTVSEGDAIIAENAIREMQWKQEFTLFKELGYSKVTAVGVGMRSYTGVAAQFFNSLAAAKIEVKMISTSEIKISAVIEKSKAEIAVRVLHKAFIN